METVEFALILLACVIATAVICQVFARLSLPLVQIAFGFVVALVVPAVSNVHIPSELFLVLFIAPLLFNEARNTNPRELWENKGSILSLAVGLVLLTVLVVGYVLNWIVPSIPLAAAFACAAALAPTDAAAVGSLGATVSLKKRQDALLSGESLINDASGVVAFQFASAAALTGAFSLVEAGESFLYLFFGGIGIGAVLGALGLFSMRLLRRRGHEGTTVHVLYEVFSPFFVFLFAEWIGASGILAVVAAGLVMADRQTRLTSPDAAQRQVVSNGFWRIAVFLINSVVFILLGMQLPQAFGPALSDDFSLPFLIGLVLLTTLLIMACRFVWVLAMELVHRIGREPHRKERVLDLLKNALILTVGGPKGAVTLSIIFTLPLTMADGTTPFPERDLIVFLTASVILCTLLLADGLLPVLAPRGHDTSGASEKELRRATVRVLENTLWELQTMLNQDGASPYTPALRLTIAHYRVRLTHEREALNDGFSHQLEDLTTEVRRVQQEKADQIHAQGGHGVEKLTPYYAMLRNVRRSVGYDGTDVKVGSRFHSPRGWLALLWQRTKPNEVNDEQAERMYYDTCLFAIELEHAAIDYLKGIIAQNDDRKTTAQALLAEHQAVLESLWNRINYGQHQEQKDRANLTMGHEDGLPDGMEPLFGKQFAEAARYADEVDANALTIELDQIRHLQQKGDISDAVANELRQRVYALQMSLTD